MYWGDDNLASSNFVYYVEIKSLGTCEHGQCSRSGEHSLSFPCLDPASGPRVVRLTHSLSLQTAGSLKFHTVVHTIVHSVGRVDLACEAERPSQGTGRVRRFLQCHLRPSSCVCTSGSSNAWRSETCGVNQTSPNSGAIRSKLVMDP